MVIGLAGVYVSDEKVAVHASSVRVDRSTLQTGGMTTARTRNQIDFPLDQPCARPVDRSRTPTKPPEANRQRENTQSA